MRKRRRGRPEGGDEGSTVPATIDLDGGAMLDGLTPVIEPTRDKALMGAAGVHFVASELSLRGLIALPTVRNTAGIDIVAVNKKGTWQANLQVKTSRSKVSFWPVGKHFDDWCGRNNYYVFVRYLLGERRFEAFLETSRRVAEQLTARMADEKARGLKEWAPCWFLQKEEYRLRRQWVEFGRGKE